MTPINWWALPNPLPPQKKKLLSFSPSPHKKKNMVTSSSTATRTLCGMGENHEKGERLSVSGIRWPKNSSNSAVWRWQRTPRTGSWTIKICGKKTRPKTGKRERNCNLPTIIISGVFAVSFQGCEANGDEISQFRSGFFMCFCCWLWDFERMLRCKPYMRRRQYDVIWWYDMQR